MMVLLVMKLTIMLLLSKRPRAQSEPWFNVTQPIDFRQKQFQDLIEAELHGIEDRDSQAYMNGNSNIQFNSLLNNSSENPTSYQDHEDDEGEDEDEIGDDEDIDYHNTTFPNVISDYSQVYNKNGRIGIYTREVTLY